MAWRNTRLKCLRTSQHLASHQSSIWATLFWSRFAWSSVYSILQILLMNKPCGGIKHLYTDDWVVWYDHVVAMKNNSACCPCILNWRGCCNFSLCKTWICCVCILRFQPLCWYSSAKLHVLVFLQLFFPSFPFFSMRGILFGKIQKIDFIGVSLPPLLFVISFFFICWDEELTATCRMYISISIFKLFTLPQARVFILIDFRQQDLKMKNFSSGLLSHYIIRYQLLFNFFLIYSLLLNVNIGYDTYHPMLNSIFCFWPKF